MSWCCNQSVFSTNNMSLDPMFLTMTEFCEKVKDAKFYFRNICGYFARDFW